MAGRNRIDWDNIKVTLVEVDNENSNPLNPCSHMTPAERREEIIDISAEIWMRHCRDKLEQEDKKVIEKGVCL